MWEKFYNFYNMKTSESPKLFGAVHILYACAAVAIVIMLLFALQKGTRKQVRGLIIATWILLLLNEIFFNILDGVSESKVLGTDFRHEFAPVQPQSLMLWVLPFYFLIPIRKWERLLLPFIGITSLSLGGFVLAWPALALSSFITSNVYIMLQAIFTFSLGSYLILKGKISWREKWTYISQIIGMSVVIIICVFLNQIVFRGAKGNENIIEGWNFLYSSHNLEFPYLTDLSKEFDFEITKSISIAYIVTFNTILVFGLLIPYGIFMLIFRPFVKALDTRAEEREELHRAKLQKLAV